MKHPKDKAKELVEKMLYKSPTIQDGISMIDTIYAKQCAIIAVDEIIDEIKRITLINTYSLTDLDTKYWQEVKQEINNL